MARSTPIQNSFNAGEISPVMAGRVDKSRYESGLSLCENFHILSQGPIRRRSGTEFVVGTNGNNKTRLHPFIYSKETAYILAFGNTRVDVFENEADPSVTVSGTVPYATADVFDLNFTQSADVLYITHPDYSPHKIERTASTPTFAISRIDTDDGPYLDVDTSGTTLSIQDPTVGATRQIDASAADVFVADDDNAAGRLIRWRYPDGTIWGWGRIDAYTAADDVTMTVIRAADGSPSSSGTDYSVEDFRLGAWGFDEDATPANRGPGWPSTVTFYQNRLVFAGGKTSPETIWASNTGDFENFAPTDEIEAENSPATQGISEITDANAFTFTLAAGYTGQVNTIRWLAPTRDLVVGTDGGISTMSSDQTGAVTPNNVFVRESNTYGTKNIQPLRVEDFVVYVSHTGRKVRGLGYSFNDDSYVSEDVSILSSEILRSGVTQMGFQREPHGVIWMVRADGELVSLTLERTQKVAGFARHILGGTFGSQTFVPGDVDIATNIVTVTSHGFSENDGPVRLRTDDTLQGGLRSDLNYFIHVLSANTLQFMEAKGGQRPVDITSIGSGTTTILPRAVVESVAVIPATASSSDHDQVWLVVKREVGGSTVRHIEFMKNDFEVGGDKAFAWFVDSGWSQSGTDIAITTAGKLNHLIGETVQILGDGAVQTDRIVDSSGQVVIDPVADEVAVGLKFESNMLSNNYEIATQEGTSQGKRKRMHNVGIRFDSTVEGMVGPDAANLEEIQFRTPDDSMDEAPPLFTGDKAKIETQSDWGVESTVYIRQGKPLPMTIVAVMPWFEAANR